MTAYLPDEIGSIIITVHQHVCLLYIFSYAFKTQHYIMFGISYKVDDSEEELLYEQNMQTNSDIVPYVGEIIAEEKSTCKLKWTGNIVAR